MQDAGFIAPFGFRVYTPDDWVVRIEYPDGTVIRKGVDGKVDRDQAVHSALSSTRGRTMPSEVDIRRRRDWSKAQA